MNANFATLAAAIGPHHALHLRETPLCGLHYLAEDIRPGFLFCQVDEYLRYNQWITGESQLAGALANGAAALLLPAPRPEIPLPQLIVDHPRQAMARAAAHLTGHPEEKLTLVGITGTNGKTTISHLSAGLLQRLGRESAALGTLGLYRGGEMRREGIYTTPLAPDLWRLLAELVAEGAETLSMEVSSHALALDRAFGLPMAVAVFSNLTQDHLDFHGNMTGYGAAKGLLFRRLEREAAAVINADDPFGAELARTTPARVITYGLGAGAALRAGDIIPGGAAGTRFTVHWQGRQRPVETRLSGGFNVANALAAMGVGLALGHDLDAVVTAAAAFRGAPGRMEPLPLPGERLGIIDFAHTPDALEKVLTALREGGAERIITVFGCGGDRDRGKRPLMGAVAERLSAHCVVTSDNPRSEPPDAIIADILAGMAHPARATVEPDRRRAIGAAWAMSRPGDLILLAGKGHERHQLLGTEKVPFNDREVLAWTAGLDNS